MAFPISHNHNYIWLSIAITKKENFDSSRAHSLNMRSLNSEEEKEKDPKLYGF